MIKLTYLLHEMNLDQARFYTSLDRAVAQKVINPLWNYLKSQADYVSRNGERLFFNFTGDKTLMTDISTLISSYEDPKGATYQVSNFKDGIVLKTVQTERGSKEVQMSLGKVLQMISKEEPEAKDLLDLYNRDMGARRASSSTDTPVIVISKHPVDIGNMSTDRDWGTCMRLPNAQDIEGGSNYSFIECDVKQGTLIAYYLEEGGDLKSLKNAIGKVTIKPYYKEVTGDLLMAPGKVYGKVPQSFKDFVNNLLKSSNLYKVTGLYQIDKSLYMDRLKYTLHGSKNFKDLYKTKKNKDFSNMDLTLYSGFSELDLSGANFTNCILKGANLLKANLEGANLLKANLEGADLEGANLLKANLEGANLEEVNLEGAYLKGAYLERADLEGADLEGADLEGANLKRANLEVVYLVGANLVGTNLEGANLEGAHLKHANLSNARLQNTRMYKTNLQGANLSGVDLSNSWLLQSNLTSVDLRAADLSQVQELDSCKGLNTLIWDEYTKWPSNFNIEDYQ